MSEICADRIKNGKKQRLRAGCKKAARLALFALITAFILTELCACLKPISVDSYGYVVAIGVDAGSEKEYEITLELQRESTGDSQEGSGGAIILSVEARDLFDAVSEIAAGSAYELNFTRTHLFVIGESIAREGRIAEFFNMSFDVLRIRRSALLIVARCPVRDYIGGLAANNTANIAKMQDSLISHVEKTGETAAVNVSLLYESLMGGRFDVVMPLGTYDESIITDMKQRDSANKGENPIADAKKGARIGGMQGLTQGGALFDGARMCGELSSAQTQFMNMVRGDFRSGTIEYALPDGKKASLLAVMNRRRIKVEPGANGARASASIELFLNITVEQDPSGNIGKGWNEGERERLEAFLSSQLMSVFEKCRAAGSDAMGLGRYASMNFTSTREWESYSWKQAYKHMQAEFKVKLNLDDEYLVKPRQ